ncbi:hypothetical protein BKA70DRAFT_1300280 [Coprinopsis sp. MPI-PUGE-AT-0042]|nr:hypothetical protein BKA70DRAFT_1300280 [Coprinopsis sp. MPI-PUGE-AT-0042]
MLAAKGGHESVVRLLIDVPHISTTMESIDGNTPMLIALANGHVGICSLLQEFEIRRAESNSRDRSLWAGVDLARLSLEEISGEGGFEF